MFPARVYDANIILYVGLRTNYCLINCSIISWNVIQIVRSSSHPFIFEFCERETAVAETMATSNKAEAAKPL